MGLRHRGQKGEDSTAPAETPEGQTGERTLLPPLRHQGRRRERTLSAHSGDSTAHVETPGAAEREDSSSHSFYNTGASRERTSTSPQSGHQGAAERELFCPGGRHLGRCIEITPDSVGRQRTLLLICAHLDSTLTDRVNHSSENTRGAGLGPRPEVEELEQAEAQAEEQQQKIHEGSVSKPDMQRYMSRGRYLSPASSRGKVSAPRTRLEEVSGGQVCALESGVSCWCRRRQTWAAFDDFSVLALR
ncbi:unnamed protein product [Arctogadus glacialis]